jgi:hypothetical protein
MDGSDVAARWARSGFLEDSGTPRLMQTRPGAAALQAARPAGGPTRSDVHPGGRGQ